VGRAAGWWERRGSGLIDQRESSGFEVTTFLASVSWSQPIVPSKVERICRGRAEFARLLHAPPYVNSSLIGVSKREKGDGLTWDERNPFVSRYLPTWLPLSTRLIINQFNHSTLLFLFCGLQLNKRRFFPLTWLYLHTTTARLVPLGRALPPRP
jgi:hypothetical protein